MKIVTMGEIMLRLSPEGNGRFTQASAFEASWGGAEANVAVLLAQLGEEAVFVTKLPDGDIGQAAVYELRKFGVETGFIARGEGRMGIYFLEKGESGRPSKVIYDRADSAMAKAAVKDFDFKEIFRNCGWFHFTGITPAISDAAASLTEEALKQAKAACVPVSCDLNYRSSLWSREKAGAVLSRLMEYVDVCITNPEQSEDVFGIPAGGTDGDTTGVRNMERIGREMAGRFGIQKTAFTARENISASDNVLSAVLFSCGKVFRSKDYPVHIVDRVGGGDAFAAGLIYGMMHGFTDERTVEFASAANAFKHTIEGDFCLAELDEISDLAWGRGDGRIKR